MIFVGFWAVLIILLITGRTMSHCKGRRQEADEEKRRDLVRMKWLEKAPRRQTPSFAGGQEEHLRNARAWEAMEQPQEKVFQSCRPGMLLDEAVRSELDAGPVLHPFQPDIQYWSTSENDLLFGDVRRPIRPCGLGVDKSLPLRPLPAYIRDSHCSRAGWRSSHSVHSLPPTPRLSRVSTIDTEIFEEDPSIPSSSRVMPDLNLEASVCQGVVPQTLDARRGTLIPGPDRQPVAEVWNRSPVAEKTWQNSSPPSLESCEDELAPGREHYNLQEKY
jgi:hypothetical protein